MTTLHVVVSTVGGFAREDAARPRCVGVYTDPVVAGQVRTLAGPGTEVQTIEVDHIPPGLLEAAQHMGFEIGRLRGSGAKPR